MERAAELLLMPAGSPEKLKVAIRDRNKLKRLGFLQVPAHASLAAMTISCQANRTLLGDAPLPAFLSAAGAFDI